MEFNWITVLAQVINFLILVWLLKLLLYKPVLKAMADRQKRLADLEEDWLQKKQQAEEQMQNYSLMTKNLDQDKLEILAQAHKEAEEERRLLVSNSRAEIDQMKKGWEETLKREQSAFLKEGSFLIGKESIRIAGTVLSDLAGVELEVLLVHKFTSRIEQLAPEEIHKMHLGINQNNNRIIVLSAFALSAIQRKELEELLRAKLGAEINLDFETNEPLLAGIEINAGGYHLGWSIEHNLHDLEEKLRRYFDKNTTGAEYSNDQ